MNDNPVSIRQPAVAGSFYPAEPVRLRNVVRGMLAEARESAQAPVRALIVPHAGYRYSGPIAASGFRQLSCEGNGCTPTVFLIGPAHYVPVPSGGIALAPFDRFDTPLGPVPQNRSAVDALLGRGSTYRSYAPAHVPEHSLEVELPFLQERLDDFDLVAMLCGQPPADRIAADLAEHLRPDDLVVISSDLSHFHPYEDAQRRDRSFLDAVVAGDVRRAAQGEACGLQPILILMHLARLLGWQPALLDYRNSGDTGGDRWRVVGYAAVAYS